MTKLTDIGKIQRGIQISPNEIQSGNEYNESHPDAMSTGDEDGKGENNGQVGGTTDIKLRTTSNSKNIYGAGKEYNVTD